MGEQIKFLGNTDDVTTCDCCGRANLKSTVALSFDDADPVFYGVVCAAKALKVDAKFVRSSARKADEEKAEQERAARNAAHNAHMAKWSSFLAANGTGSDLFTQIESLGGYKAAYAMFEKAAA